jgi:hypothetical protein
MYLDNSNFPLVWMSLTGSADRDTGLFYAEFESLLAREQSFVLLSDDKHDENSHEHTPAERKQITLWMKKNKSALRSFVKGMVQIEPNAAKRVATKAFAVMFGKFWGYPLLVAASKTQALEIAQKLVAGETMDA